MALLQTILHEQPFGDAGALAWIAYAVFGVRSLHCLRTGEHRLASWAQLLWWLVWPFVASLTLYWVVDTLHLAQGWGVAAIALPWLAMATLAQWRWQVARRALARTLRQHVDVVAAAWFPRAGDRLGVQPRPARRQQSAAVDPRC